MAKYNLWEADGKQTSFNPLPGAVDQFTRIGVAPNTDLRVSFKAKSPTNAILRISAGPNLYADFTLTNELKEYVATFTTVLNYLYIYDKNGANNIVIQDIQLVEKPLGRATINGIDGFRSGKWIPGKPAYSSIPLDFEFPDDATCIVHSRDTNWKEITVDIPILPNTEYNFSAEFSEVNSFRMDNLNASKTYIGMFYNASALAGKWSTSFITTSSTAFVRIYFQTNKITDLIIKNPMLNLGSTPAPYEPKRGERMVLPVASGKNLFDGLMELGIYDSANGMKTFFSTAIRSVSLIPVEPNTTYTASNDKGYTAVWTSFNANKTFISNPQVINNTFTTDSNTYFVGLRTLTATNENDLSVKFQVEKGSAATPFESYRVRTTRKRTGPIRKATKLPKKNMIVSQALADFPVQSKIVLTEDNGFFKGVVTGAVSTDNYAELKNAANKTGIYYPIPCEGNAEYTFSADIKSDGTLPMRLRIVELTDVGGVTKDNLSSVAVTSVSAQRLEFTITTRPETRGLLLRVRYETTVNGLTGWFANLQLEPGKPTSFEPYKPISRRAPKGLKFNGVTDHISIPSVTFDSIEVDLILDTVQPSPNPFIYDARNDAMLWVSDASPNIAQLVDKFYIDDVESAETWASIPRDKRIRVKTWTAIPYTAGANFFSRFGPGSNRGAGTLLGIKYFLKGQIVAEYDFKDPRTAMVPGIVKAKLGPNGTITGNPYQLNRIARR